MAKQSLFLWFHRRPLLGMRNDIDISLLYMYNIADNSHSSGQGEIPYRR